MTKARSNATANAAKGDLTVGNGTNLSGVLSVSQNGDTIVADSSTATGLKWAPRGKINQVVQGTYTGQTTITSTSYVTTLLTATITPTATTSKVLIQANVPFYGTPDEIRFTIFRGTVAGTDLCPTGAFAQNKGIEVKTASLLFLDSPSTTSAQVYTIGVKLTGGTAYTINSPSTGVITLTEVLA